MHFGNEETVHHASGSMRMSENQTEVIHEDLRLEAYDTLYVCNISVFSMIPTANPGLTLAALALWLADRLTVLP